MSIIVLGTVALDTVKTPYGVRKDILGGSAAHFAMAARFFTSVNVVANVGEDFPKKYVDFLRRQNIILDSLKIGEGRTFRWDGEYKDDMNAAITLNTELGVLTGFKPAITDRQKDIKYVFLANVDPDIQNGLLSQMRSPKLIGLDSMNYWIKHKKNSLLKMLKKTDIFVANDAEARALSGEANLIKAARRLCSLGPRMVVVKKGEHGGLFCCNKFIFCLPAYPMDEVIDPTGAGDTFAGGFMGYLAKAKKLDENTIRRAIAYGTILASFCVEDFGLAKTANLSFKEINKRLRLFKKIIKM